MGIDKKYFLAVLNFVYWSEVNFNQMHQSLEADMSNKIEHKTPINLQDKYNSLFHYADRDLSPSNDDLWLAQPFAQKTVKSTTTSSFFVLPEIPKLD